MIELNKIYNEDCLLTLDKMSDNFIDLTVTSPPYNVDLGNNKHYKNKYSVYDDNKEHTEYISWLEEIFSKIYQKTKSGGRCVINIGDSSNGKIPLHSIITVFMQKIGWLPLANIIWNKQVTARTAWGSFQSPSAPSFPVPYEFILVFCKDSYKLEWQGETDLTKDEFIKWSLSIWDFSPENRTNKVFNHPAMFPEDLPMRCIKMLSWIDSVVYDPFSGCGTTAYVCKKLNRNFIGSEISEQYCKTAHNRLISIPENLF